MATTEHATVDNPHQYVDFDEYVSYHLARTQSGIKYSEILTTLGWIATLGLAYLLLFTVLDHWFIDGGFSRAARVALLLGMIGIGLGWFAWRVVLPYLRRINALYAAREIERATPTLKGGLLNLVDLQHANKRIPDHVRVAIEKRAALELSNVDVDHAVDRRPLMRVSYLLLAVVTACCLYALFSPKDILASVKRALLPTSATAPPTQTRITNVEPGNVTVVAGATVTVKANIGGRMPEQVMLYYSTSDRKYVDEPVAMEQPDAELPAFVATLSGENGRGLLEDLTYRIEAGDAATHDFQITVTKPPSADVQSVAYEFPSYMEMENRTEPTGHISAHEGTVVRIEAQTNIPVATAKIVFVENEQPTGEEVRMKVTDGTRLSGEWKLAIRDDGTFAPHYWIECQTEDGRTDPDPTRYNVMIKPDQAPLIELLAPQRDLQMPANGIVPLVYRAADPDFRLRSVRLQVVKDGSVIVSDPLVDEDRLGKAVQGRYEWKLEPLKLTTGERLQFYLQAKDNRIPLANTKQTAKLNVEIIDPVSEEEAQEQLEQEKQKQQEELQQDTEEPQNARDEDQPKNDGPNDQGEPQQEDSESGDPGDGQQGNEETAEGEPNEQQQRQPGQDGDASEASDDEQTPGDQPGGSGEPGDAQDGSAQEERPLDPNNQQDQEEALKRILENQKQRDQNGQDGARDPQQQQNENKRNGAKQDNQKQDGDQQQKQQQPGDKQDNENQNGNESQPGGRNDDDPQQPGDEGDQQPGTENADQPDDARSEEGDPSKNKYSDSPKNEKKPQDGQKPQGEPGAQGADKDLNPGEDPQSENDPNSKDSSPGREKNDQDKPNPAQGDGKNSGEKPDEEQPGREEDDVNGTEKPAAGDENAKKKEATGDETGKGKAADERDAEKAKKQLDREGDKNEKTRKPGDPADKPQDREQGAPHKQDPNQTKPQPGKSQQSSNDPQPAEKKSPPKGNSQTKPQQKQQTDPQPNTGDKKPPGQNEQKQQPPDAPPGEEKQDNQNPEGGDKPPQQPEPDAGDQPPHA